MKPQILVVVCPLGSPLCLIGVVNRWVCYSGRALIGRDTKPSHPSFHHADNRDVLTLRTEYSMNTKFCYFSNIEKIENVRSVAYRLIRESIS